MAVERNGCSMTSVLGFLTCTLFFFTQASITLATVEDSARSKGLVTLDYVINIETLPLPDLTPVASAIKETIDGVTSPATNAISKAASTATNLAKDITDAAKTTVANSIQTITLPAVTITKEVADAISRIASSPAASALPAETFALANEVKDAITGIALSPAVSELPTTKVLRTLTLPATILTVKLQDAASNIQADIGGLASLRGVNGLKP